MGLVKRKAKAKPKKRGKSRCAGCGRTGPFSRAHPVCRACFVARQAATAPPPGSSVTETEWRSHVGEELAELRATVRELRRGLGLMGEFAESQNHALGELRRACDKYLGLADKMGSPIGVPKGQW